MRLCTLCQTKTANALGAVQQSARSALLGEIHGYQCGTCDLYFELWSNVRIGACLCFAIFIGATAGFLVYLTPRDISYMVPLGGIMSIALLTTVAVKVAAIRKHPF
jgi:hypothetical protein